MKISILLETLSIPISQRRHFINEFGGMDSSVICYHVTEAENENSICKNGLVAKECDQGRVTREAAVYLFVSKSDITEEIIGILGIKNPIIIKAKLTDNQLLDKAYYDGMFNMSFDSWSAIQYLDNIKSEAIR